MKHKHHIPESVKRELRNEVSYGCAICGNPLITYHHIIPLEEKIHNEPKHMIALCPTHHQLADNGTIKRKKLYEYKEKPFNIDKAKDRFQFESKIPGIVLGSIFILLIKNIINFDGKVVLAMNVSSSGFLQLDAELYDIDGNLIAIIKNNEWIVFIKDIWDMKYQGKHIKIWNEKRKIGFDIEYKPQNDLIFINGRFCYNNRSIKVSKKNGVTLEQTNSRVHNMTVIGPGQSINVFGGTILNINFPAKNLIYVPIENENPPKNTVFAFPKTNKVCFVDKKAKIIHLLSCRYITSQTELDYESISKAEEDGYTRCKVCL